MTSALYVYKKGTLLFQYFTVYSDHLYIVQYFGFCLYNFFLIYFIFSIFLFLRFYIFSVSFNMFDIHSLYSCFTVYSQTFIVTFLSFQNNVQYHSNIIISQNTYLHIFHSLYFFRIFSSNYNSKDRERPRTSVLFPS